MMKHEVVSLEYQIGQIVYSKSGRDKGRIMVIVGLEDNFVFLCDGKLRKLDKPKRKKDIHLQHTKYVSRELANQLERGEKILDSDIRKVIELYEEQ